MASAKDVTVVIPVSMEHLKIAERAFDSTLGGEALPCIDNLGHGVCYARNQAIYMAETPLILPLDADDYLLPGAVERMAQAWQPGKVVYGNWISTDDWLSAPPPEMLNRKHVCHATYLFAKEDWQRVGGYDPDFNIGAEDWAFMIALANAGCELVRLNGDPLYVKTMNENGRTHKAVRHKDMIRQLLLEKYPEFMTR